MTGEPVQLTVVAPEFLYKRLGQQYGWMMNGELEVTFT